MGDTLGVIPPRLFEGAAGTSVVSADVVIEFVMMVVVDEVSMIADPAVVQDVLSRRSVVAGKDVSSAVIFLAQTIAFAGNHAFVISRIRRRVSKSRAISSVIWDFFGDVAYQALDTILIVEAPRYPLA